MEEELIRLCLFCAILQSLSTITNSSSNIITTDHPISDGNTIASPGAYFELGFFSPGKSKNRYVGIWYGNIPSKDVVWVANRETPLNDTSGVLTIRGNGHLVLLDGNNNVVWSSNSSMLLRNPVALLTDAGNLVVSDSGSGDLAWQSFDFPGDTQLPGMKLGKDLVTGHAWSLTSWRSSDDPAIGEYMNALDDKGYPQFVLVRPGTTSVLSRSGPWNGVMFSGMPNVKNNSYFTCEFHMDQREIYFRFVLIDPSTPTRVLMAPSGLMQRLFWIERTQSWIVYSTAAQTNICDHYAMCGPFGICSINSSPPCDCLTGFTPKYPQQWDAADWSNGCVRRTHLDCGDKDGFLKYTGIKLPDTQRSWFDKSIDLHECKRLCLKNCNCTAYSNVDITNGGSGCLLWFGDLIDIREFDEVDQALYVRISASDLGSSQNRKTIREAMVIAIPTISGVLILCILAWYALRKWRRGSKIDKEDQDIPLFALETLVSATNNFSSTNLIGKGGFGPVYKGNLLNGTEIAVKKLSENSGQGAQEWESEVSIIAKLQHRNLVTLLGCCAEGGQRMLIYEFMPNNSLDYFIFDDSKKQILKWQKRFTIAVGISRGLLYLHQDARLRIIHRDLKAGNILLDAELNPKISDFGLARILREDDILARTKRVIGTYGYMSPEYAMNGNFSIKSDVFSFGVLLLELVSGRKNRTLYHFDHPHNLLGHAWLLWSEGDPLELMDDCLRDTHVESHQVLRCINVALLCVSKLPEDRPTMPTVVFMLENEEEVALPQPKEPGFFITRSSTQSSSTNHENLCSQVAISFSVLEGR